MGSNLLVFVSSENSLISNVLLIFSFCECIFFSLFPCLLFSPDIFFLSVIRRAHCQLYLCFSGTLEINCSKEIKIQGIIGPCTSLEKVGSSFVLKLLISCCLSTLELELVVGQFTELRLNQYVIFPVFDDYNHTAERAFCC